jgi:hypothetical protein
MVCIHIVGVWKFLRIGAGADSVKVAFCTVCPACLGCKATAAGYLSGEDSGDDEFQEVEDTLDKIQQLAASKPLRDTMTDIKKANDIVIAELFDKVEMCLTKVRPPLEVGKEVKFLCDNLPWIPAGGRNSVVQS